MTKGDKTRDALHCPHCSGKVNFEVRDTSGDEGGFYDIVSIQKGKLNDNWEDSARA